MVFLIYIEEKGGIYRCDHNECEYCGRALESLSLKHFIGREDAVTCTCKNNGKYPLLQILKINIKTASRCHELLGPKSKAICNPCQWKANMATGLVARRQKKVIKEQCEVPWCEDERRSPLKRKNKLYQRALTDIVYYQRKRQSHENLNSATSPSFRRRRCTRTRGEARDKRKVTSARKASAATKKKVCMKDTPTPMKRVSENCNKALGSITPRQLLRSPSALCRSGPNLHPSLNIRHQQVPVSHIHWSSLNPPTQVQERDSIEQVLCFRSNCSCNKYHPSVTDISAIKKAYGLEKKANTHQIVAKSSLTKLRNVSSSMKETIARLTTYNKFHSHHNIQRALLGVSAICTPKCSQEVMEIHSILDRTATIMEIGNTIEFPDLTRLRADLVQHTIKSSSHLSPKIYAEDLVRSCVKYKTFGNLVLEQAATSLLLEREEMLESCKALYISNDKNMDGNLVKVESRFCRNRDKVKWFLLDVEKCTGYSSHTALALDHSLKRFFLPDQNPNNLERPWVAGIATDDGGGGTGASLMKEMILLKLCDEFSLMKLCDMHGIDLPFKEFCINVVGEGGLTKRNGLQFAHSIKDLQDALGISEWRFLMRVAADKLGLEICDDKGRIITIAQEFAAPIPTRWWTLARACSIYFYNTEIINEVIILVIESRSSKKNDKSSNGKAVTIAVGAFSLMNEGIIRADIYLIHSFATYFQSPHLEWLQDGDERIGGTPGFKVRLGLSRLFLMDQDIKELADGGWRTKEEFEGFVKVLENVSDEVFETETDRDGNTFLKVDEPARNIKFRPLTTEQKAFQIKKANNIYTIVYESLYKINHLKQYLDQDKLLFLALFDEAPIAKVVARMLLGEIRSNWPEEDKIYCHPYHDGREIDLQKFGYFIQKSFDLSKFERDFETNYHHRKIVTTKVIHEIALSNTTSSIWELDKQGELFINEDEDGKNFYTKLHREQSKIAETYKDYYAALPSTTHFVESSVKTTDDTDNGSRTELKATQLAIGSNIIREKNDLGKQLMIEAKNEKGQHYKDNDKIIVRGEYSQLALLAIVGERERRSAEILREDPSKGEILKKMRDSLSKVDLSFASKLEEKKREEGTKQRERNRAKKAPKAALAVGVHHTETMRGRYPFKKLKKDAHFNLLKKEVEERGCIFPEGTNWTTYRKKLKALVVEEENSKDATSFMPRTCKFSDFEDALQKISRKVD